ncbi:RNB-like protein [uncultured Desulfobacterium sp.]|uniref:RNB-like protein n=1 Tax=uncultured Desulfobacterium sp. TaxID=201089 RepID=A0A445N2V9_9BACT|nr:RNB-like protein [uncultured Desulfobacterium sp.]
MHQGKVIEYIDQGRFICTICLQDKGSSLHLLTSSNREVNLSPKRAVIVSESAVNVSKPREDLLHRLRHMEEARLSLVGQVNTKELWELVHDEKESFGARDFAQLAFGKDITDDHMAALVRSLFDDRVYFKMKDGLFLPNTPEKVEQILVQREEDALRQQKIDTGSSWLKDKIEGRHCEDPANKDEIIGLLIQMALYGTYGDDTKYGKELLTRAGISDIKKSRDLLIDLGVWQEDENLDLLRSGIGGGFSENITSESALVAGTEVDFCGREDLRDLFVMTVDGPLTRDFDDSISVEVTDDQIRLGIHIADVASIIAPESLIDQEAAKRGSSLYLPERQIPMIPHELSQGALSLMQDCDRPAISLLASFERSGGLLDYRFAASTIRVKKRLTYEEADNMLSLQEVTSAAQHTQNIPILLQEVFGICKRLQQERMNNDAMKLSLPELQVVFNDNSTFSLVKEDQDTPSRMMIAELMILYNCLAAEFCRDNQIPALYRTQAEPTERLADDEADYIYYVFKQRRKLSPVRIETTGLPHSGLGLKSYLHATSPIRRYLDLVIQRQIRNLLLGQAPVYDQKRLEEIRVLVEPTIKDLQNIKRNSTRYWTLKYLDQRRGERYPAIVLDEFKRKFRVVLKDFFLVAEINKPNGLMVKPGEEIVVEVRKADPWEDELKMEYVG